jgi:hypothetical protein
MISMIYDQAGETLRFASRNEHSFWPFFIMGRRRQRDASGRAVGTDNDSGMAPQAVEIAENHPAIRRLRPP